MLLEEVDGSHLLILPLKSCRIHSVESALGSIRSSFPEAQTQLMRADRICGRDHLIFAARNAMRAFSGSHRRSHSLAIELLLYASGQRQISKAIETLGVTPQTPEIVATAFAKREILLEFTIEVAKILAGKPDDRVIEVLSEQKAAQLMKVYGVTNLELKSARLPDESRDSVLTRLIIERSALLTVQG